MDTNAYLNDLFGLSGVYSTVPRFNCDVCGRHYRFKSDFEIHYRIHTGEKPYVCSGCGRGFNRRHNLKVHSATCYQNE